eukprot:CAMPEP_0194156426 /NCGR_PEP_ID=MMETSP0152-20130528/68326_1 /TAXON_ID=1049557 /ORGANISM="Thalassiothrix antarctica, Strain L6-D1" /LENGTH=66 /DNA_ID=CAMNT_0038864091 /DNA_START=301 /DNA_END=501 /DNA_ORIENTATION=-
MAMVTGLTKEPTRSATATIVYARVPKTKRGHIKTKTHPGGVQDGRLRPGDKSPETFSEIVSSGLKI